MVPWRLFSIQKLNNPKRVDLLPVGEFTLYHQKLRQKVYGWLPSHHGDVIYSLTLSSSGAKDVRKIISIDDIEVSKKKGRPTFQPFAKKISSDKKRGEYLSLVDNSRKSIALWTLSVIYSFYTMPKDIGGAFLQLVADLKRICTRRDELSVPYLVYNHEKSKKIINRALKQLGELPKSSTWTSLDKLMEWQLSTRWDTASFKDPGIVENGIVEKYQGKWADKNDIKDARAIAALFTPENTETIQGSPCPSSIATTDVILFRNTEDMYKWKCRVNGGTLCLLKKRMTIDKYQKLGVGDCQELKGNLPHLVIAYAHLWSGVELLKLVDYNIQKFTLIGRLDQYPRGRGNIFRDMCEAKTFQNTMCRHVGAEAIAFIEMKEIKNVIEKHGVVQGFSNTPVELELNRIKLPNPYRIRSIRQTTKTKTLLYEEQCLESDGEDASVISVRSFHGLKPEAAIYICSSKTTSFDIHVARTQCKNTLYIIGQAPSMFAFERRPPKSITINPFI